MNFEMFCEKVVQAMKEYMGEEVKVRLEKIIKNNGLCLNGLIVWRKDCCMTPTIYLEPYYEMMDEENDFGMIMQKIICNYENYAEYSIDVETLTDFERVKDKIVLRLINYEQNKALLNTIPHRRWLDLAIAYHYEFAHPQIGNGIVVIRNSHMELWGISEEELYELAKLNSQNEHMDDLSSMSHFIEGLQSEFVEEMDYVDKLAMYILTNKKGIYGAAVVLYSDRLKELTKRVNYNLFLIPSSIHEWIVICDDGTKEVTDIAAMIREVNDTQLEKEQILSYSLYYYDAVRECISVVQ